MFGQKSNFLPAFIQHHLLTRTRAHTHTHTHTHTNAGSDFYYRVNFSFPRSKKLFLWIMINLEVLLVYEFNNIFGN